MTRAPILLVLALSLAACGGAKKQQGAGTAEGEVLPGSASDAMLPLDTVTSQPPLAPKAASADKGETNDAGTDHKPRSAAQDESSPSSSPVADNPEEADRTAQ